MPLIRITESRVMEGYDKASFVYEAGETYDTADMPEGHLARLEAAGVVEIVADATSPAGPAAAKTRKARA